MRTLSSILNDPSSIGKDTDNELIKDIIVNWATTEGGIRQKDFDKGRIEYDPERHTLIFDEKFINYENNYFFPTIEDKTKTSPNLIWTINDKTIYKPLLKELYSFGLSVNDIHIQMPNELDTLYYVGDMSMKKECVDARNIKRVTSFGFVGNSVIKFDKEYKFDYKNINNLKYILPNTFILYFTVPCIDLNEEVSGLKTWYITTYKFANQPKTGLLFENELVFINSTTINPHIDQKSLLNKICNFAKLNPNVGIIHTLSNSGHSIVLKIQESFSNHKIIFTNAK